MKEIFEKFADKDSANPLLTEPFYSDTSCKGCKWDGVQLGMRSPCDFCKRFHYHHKDLYVSNQ